MKIFFPIACSVCFGNPHSPLSKGAIAGVIFLAMVVSSVLAAIAAIAFIWNKRSKRLGHSF